ncbi:hypothetical protein EC991_008533 [Linnemannia zychae]|nr:hypothetical protein EC991_008533 [Linnemannia zychae]
MMTGGRLGLLGGVQQTSDGNILRRSQESGRHGFSPKEATLAHEQQRFDTNSAVEVILDKGRIVEQGGPATVSEQDYEVNEDSESLGLSSPPSPTLSHSPLSHSSQSTSPSSPSLSISQHPLDSDFIPDACLPEALSSSSSFSTTIPIIPEVEEEVKPCAIAVETMDRSASILQDLNEMRTPELVSPAGVDDLLDEGVFEAEEDHGVKHDLHDNDKRQDDGSQVTIEGVDGYGSLPLYTTHATPAQQQNGTVQDSDSSSSSDAVIAELKEFIFL